MSKEKPRAAKKRVTVTVRRVTTQALGYEDLRKALELPKDVRIWIHVPSGGDYSGCDLEIGNDVPLFVETITESVEIDR